MNNPYALLALASALLYIGAVLRLTWMGRERVGVSRYSPTFPTE